MFSCATVCTHCVCCENNYENNSACVPQVGKQLWVLNYQPGICKTLFRGLVYTVPTQDVAIRSAHVQCVWDSYISINQESLGRTE